MPAKKTKSKRPPWEKKYWLYWNAFAKMLKGYGQSPDEISAVRADLTRQVTGAENPSHLSMKSAQFTQWLLTVKAQLPAPILAELIALENRKRQEDLGTLDLMIAAIENRLQRVQAVNPDAYAQSIAIKLNGTDPGPWRDLDGPKLAALISALNKNRAKPLANP